MKSIQRTSICATKITAKAESECGILALNKSATTSSILHQHTRKHSYSSCSSLGSRRRRWWWWLWVVLVCIVVRKPVNIVVSYASARFCFRLALLCFGIYSSKALITSGQRRSLCDDCGRWRKACLSCRLSSPIHAEGVWSGRRNWKSVVDEDEGQVESSKKRNFSVVLRQGKQLFV